MPSLAREAFLFDFLNIPQVVGIFTGGCVERGDGSRFRRKAHAHCRTQDAHFGWICLLSAKRLTDRLLMLHELAHILCREKSHNDKYRAKLLEIGGTLDATESMGAIHKKPRLSVHVDSVSR